MSKSNLTLFSFKYSGSTLLTIYLMSHPQVASIGEFSKFYNRMYSQKEREKRLKCSCGKRFPDCEHWLAGKHHIENVFSKDELSFNFSQLKFSESFYLNTIGKYLVQKNEIEWKNPILKHLYQKEIDRRKEINYELIYGHFLSEKKVFLNAEKHLTDLIMLMQIPKLNNKVLHFVRDGRAQMNSHLKHHPNHPKSFAQMTNRWKTNMERRIKFLNQIEHKVPVLTLRYEDFCLDTERVLQQVSDFLEIDSSYDNHIPEFHVMGNYRTRNISYNEIELDEKWKQKLTQEQIKIFNKIAGDTNKKLGYE